MKSSEKITSKSLIQKAEETVAEYNMLQESDSVLVGVSGGADSVALVHVMKEIAPIFSIKIGVAHLNHSLRGNESDSDSRFVAALSEKLNLPCYTAKEDIAEYKNKHGLSLEEAGRRARYAFFENIAQKEGFNKIALGHTSDDNSELVLMYFLRGSGPLGISGIPPVRGIFNTNLLIIRPFIKAARIDIIKYISAKSLSYVDDKSNMDMKFLRNKIRHNLIPELKENYNPKIIEAINRFASIMRSEDEWMENEFKAILNKNILFAENNRIILSLSGVNALHPAAKRRITRSAIEEVKGNLRRISYSHIEAIAEQLVSDSDPWSLDLPDRIRVARTGKELIFSKEEKSLRNLSKKSSVNKKVFFEYFINEPGSVVAEKEGFKVSFSEIMNINLSNICHAGQGVAFFDMEKINFPVIIRNYLPGDRFTPLGMQGSQNIAKYLINNKVPRESRIKYPVVISNGKIIWLAGFIIDDSVKVTQGTRKVLRAELSLA